MNEDKKNDKKDDVTMVAEAVLPPLVETVSNTECRSLVLVSQQTLTTEIIPFTEQAKTKVKRKPSPKSYVKLRQITIARGKETRRKILDVLHQWAVQTKYPGVTGGVIINIVDALEFAGHKISERTVREHVLALAKAGELFCERMVYDPRRTYKPKKNKLPIKHVFEYFVSLNGDAGERGLYEVVYYTTPYYLDLRESNGRFIRR